MLVLKDINKIYTIGKSGDKNYQEVHALNDVSITFRDQEFVSILGQSGCGKTTLLNIVNARIIANKTNAAAHPYPI